jgi:cytochrome c oxidase subunit II
VPPIGPGDTEEHREPAPESETTLLDELLPEDEHAPDDVEVDAALPRYTVHEDVERRTDVVRQVNLTPRFHLYTMPLGVRRIALATLATSAVALVFSAVALAGNAGFLPGQAASPNAERVQSAFIFVAILTGFILVAVEGTLIVFVIKYRRRGRPRTAEGPQIHGSTRLEVIWTVGPVVILAAIASFVFYELPGIINAPAASAADSTTITVEGHQFYWLFRYPNGAVSIDTMIAPANQVVHERVVGLDYDVNHSWWVPDFGPKYDAIPGKVNKTWFKAPEGTYIARCAELCGIQHALMDAHVVVVPPAVYHEFISNRLANKSGVQLGKEEWRGVCEKCHRLDHTYIGPPLGGNPLLAEPLRITTLLRHGQGAMPAVGHNWTRAQIDALTSYTKRFAQTGG